MLQFDDVVPSGASGGGALGLQPVVPDGLAARGRAAAAVAPAAQSPAPALGDTAKLRRVNIADKRIINGQTDVNQLVPFKYKWAWDKYLAACANIAPARRVEKASTSSMRPPASASPTAWLRGSTPMARAFDIRRFTITVTPHRPGGAKSLRWRSVALVRCVTKPIAVAGPHCDGAADRMMLGSRPSSRSLRERSGGTASCDSIGAQPRGSPGPSRAVRRFMPA